MHQEDTPRSRQAPRFVPTLTEIVVPPGEAPAPAASADAPWVSQSEPGPELELELEPKSDDSLELLKSLELIGPQGPEPANDHMSELLARLGPELDVKLSEAIAQVIHEQMPVLNARIRQAVAEVVRDTVAGELSRSGAPDPGENP